MSTPREFTELIVDKTLLKVLFLDKMIAANSQKIFNVNVYRFVGIMITILTECFIVYGFLGHLTQTNIAIDDTTKNQITFILAYNMLHLVKIFTLLYNTDKVWHLLTTTHIHFCTSTKYRELVDIFRKYRNLTKKQTYTYIVWLLTCLISWVIFPLILDAKQPDAKVEHDNVLRYENVINFQFPVSTAVYNDYYIVFYAMEVTITYWMTYVSVSFSVFLISCSYTIIAHYEVIAQAFENVGRESEIIVKGKDSK